MNGIVVSSPYREKATVHPEDPCPSSLDRGWDTDIMIAIFWVSSVARFWYSLATNEKASVETVLAGLVVFFTPVLFGHELSTYFRRRGIAGRSS